MNDRLAAVLAEVFDMRKADIHPGLEKADVGTWDSLRQMDLVVTLEREYGLTLEIADMVRMVSVAGIVAVLRDKGRTLEIKGAIALVTGAGQGLGLAIAEHLAALGATVVAADRNPQALAALPAGLEPCSMDVTVAAEVQAAVAAVVARHGRIDILVNNAGAIFSEPFVNVMDPAAMMHDLGRFEACLQVNLTSVFIVTSAVVAQMVQRRTRGSIVNISSISAGGNKGQVAYAAAKGGVNAMTVSLAKELGVWGIRCNAVAPGFIATDSTRQALSEATLKHIQANTPLRRLGAASEVAQAVAAAVGNDFMNGAVLQVDGGLTI